MTFFSKIIYNFLNIEYKINLEANKFDEILENSWSETNKESSHESLPEAPQTNQESENLETLQQLQLEDDGIEVGSETTTEPSEYSEDLIEEEDIDDMVIKVLQIISNFVHNSDDLNYSYSLYEERNSPQDRIRPNLYTKNKRISIKVLIRHLNNWIEENYSVRGEQRFKNIEKYIQLWNGGSRSYRSDSNILIQLKHSQFFQMDALHQVEFLKTLDSESLRSAKFSAKDFKPDFILFLLRSDLKSFPHCYSLTNLRSGVFGEVFFSKPLPKLGVTTEEQYQEEEWVEREKRYEKAVDLVFEVLKGGEEKLEIFAKFLLKQSSNTFNLFIRSLLKPEIGHPLKCVDLRKIKREDFLPFKNDNGYRIIQGDLNDIDFGGHKYRYRISPGEKDFNEHQYFYVNGKQSICTRSDLRKTREELDEYPDEYVFYEGELDVGDGEEGDNNNNDNNPNPRDILGHNRADREENENHKADKDRSNPQKLYRLKKYSILEFKTRNTKQLTKTEKYDKLDNRVSTEMLRSGAAIIRKARYPLNLLSQFTREQKNQAFFIREPLYLMYSSYQLKTKQNCTKFCYIQHHQFYESARMRLNWIEVDWRGDYDCLYVKRLKKVVLRPKSLGYPGLERNKFLALERVHCKGKILNLDDPVDRDPLYDRLFKIHYSVGSKKKYRFRPLNFEKQTLQKSIKRTFYSPLVDYTTRKISFCRFSAIFGHQYHISNNVNTLERGDGSFEMITRHLRSIDKVIPRGQPSFFRSSRLSEDKFSYERSENIDNEPPTFSSIRDSQGIAMNRYDERTGLLFSWKHIYKEFLQDQLVASYAHKPKFYELGENQEGGGRFIYLKISGRKVVVRFEVEEGTMVSNSSVFRRIYLLRVRRKEVELRVLGYDAIADYVKKVCDPI